MEKNIRSSSSIWVRFLCPLEQVKVRPWCCQFVIITPKVYVYTLNTRHENEEVVQGVKLGWVDLRILQRQHQGSQMHKHKTIWRDLCLITCLGTHKIERTRERNKAGLQTNRFQHTCVSVYNSRRWCLSVLLKLSLNWLPLLLRKPKGWF